jgi:hypothetical protein
MDSAQTVFHGLCALYSVDCLWTLRGLHEDSFLIYLRKNNFNHIYINICLRRESNSGPFGHCKTTRQPTELTGHVGIGSFRKYIIPTSRDADQPTATASEPQPHPPPRPSNNHHHHQQPPPPPSPPATTTTTTTSTATNNNAATTTTWQQQQRGRGQRGQRQRG